MVYLRGVVERKVTSDEDSDSVPVLGYLPQTSRPEKNVHYPTLALDGFKLHHLTVLGAGQVQVRFDAGQQYVTLDGIAFARWSGDYGFDDWRFGTDDGDTMLVQMRRDSTWVAILPYCLSTDAGLQVRLQLRLAATA